MFSFAECWESLFRHRPQITSGNFWTQHWLKQYFNQIFACHTAQKLATKRYMCYHLRINGIEWLHSVNWVCFRFLYDLLGIVEEEHTEEYETSVHCDRVHPRSQCRGRRQEHGACKRDITMNLRQTWGQDYKEKHKLNSKQISNSTC